MTTELALCLTAGALLASVALNVFQAVRAERREAALLDRLMARDWPSYATLRPEAQRPRAGGGLTDAQMAELERRRQAERDSKTAAALNGGKV